MSKKIIVIDDDPGILYAMQLLLEEEGYQVTILDRGETLESLLKDDRPDVILLDMLLSGRDGRDITRWLKSLPTAMNVPIIMFSAHPSLPKEAVASGADDYIAKPFKIDQLLEKVAQYT